MKTYDLHRNRDFENVGMRILIDLVRLYEKKYKVPHTYEGFPHWLESDFKIKLTFDYGGRKPSVPLDSYYWNEIIFESEEHVTLLLLQGFGK